MNWNIWNMAKNNNIKGLLQAEREPHQIHSAEYIVGTMYLNDMNTVSEILDRADWYINDFLRKAEDNMQMRREAYGLINKDFDRNALYTGNRWI